MAAFVYTALTADGRDSQGVLEADSSQQARVLLQQRGLTPLSISAQADGAGSASGRGPALGVEELALFTRQLATLLQSGMALAQSLQVVARQAETAKLRSLLAGVSSGVQEGRGLAVSMAQYPRAFPGMYRATVSAGEQSGRLGDILESLASYTEARHEAAKKVQLALIYPAVLVLVAVSIVTGLLLFVVPDVVSIFIDQGAELPTLTKILVGLSAFLGDYGLILLLALIAGVVALQAALQQPAFRLRWDRTLLRLPLVGRLAVSSNTAQLTSTMAILGVSGVPLVDSMRIASDVVPNLYMKRLLEGARKAVSEGGSLHRALEDCRVFPPMMIAMIASGEMSGSLDAMLGRVAQTRQQELDNAVASALALLEPLVLIIMGVSVLLIVVAILQPIFELNQLI